MTDTRPAILRRRRLLAAMLLGLAVGAVVWLAASAPDETYVAGALSRVLGRPVEIAEFEINPGRQLEFEIGGLRVLESYDPNATAIFEVRKIRGRQSWPRLLAGQLLPSHWAVDQPLLRVSLATRSGEPGQGLPDLPEASLILARGTILWEVEDGEWLVLDDLNVNAQRGRLGRPTEGRISARLLRGDRPVGGLSLTFSGWLRDLEGKGRVEGLDLAGLSFGELRFGGSGEASFDVAQNGDVSRLSLELDAESASFELPGLSAPLKPALTRVGAVAEWRENLLAISLEPLQLDDLIVTGELELHLNVTGRVRGDLRLADFQPASPALHALHLMGLRFASWDTIRRNIRAGRVEDVRIKLDLPRKDLARSLAFRRKLRQDELQVSLRVREGRYRTGPNRELSNISGRLLLRGNVIEATQVQMRSAGKALPELNVRVDGMHRIVALPRNESWGTKGAGVPIPGLTPALAALGPGEGPGAQTATRVHFDALKLSYPAFLLPIRGARGTLVVSRGKLLVEGAKGVLGGWPAEIDLDWNTAARQVDVNIEYGDGRAAPKPGDDGTWVDAKIRIDTLRLGSWPINAGEFRLRGRRDQLALDDLHASLGGGTLLGAGTISLAERKIAPYSFGLQLLHADAVPVAASAGIPARLSGTVYGNGRISGALSPGSSFLEYGDLKLALRAVDGEVRRLPAALAIARLPSLQGVRGLLGRALPYTEITANLKIQNGQLEVSDLKLLGPELRILADGVIELDQEQQPMDMVVALLFLQTVDRLLGSVPIVRDVVLGRDRNLLATYFRVQGPRDNPSARMLAPEAIQTATGMISGGMRRLGNLIGIGGESNEDGKADKSP